MPGLLYNQIIGPALAEFTNVGGISATDMKTQNAGVAFRFTAKDTRDVAGISLHTGTVTTLGSAQYTIRIETVDASTRKPSGNLYDANATGTITPTANSWQTCTFASLPTTGLTAGTEYAVVVLTTGGSATALSLHAVYSVTTGSRLPHVCLTAADGTTRSNFAETTGSMGCFTITFEDGSEETPGMTSFTSTASAVTGTTAFGAKVTLTGSIKVTGVQFLTLRATNPVSSDVVCKILDSSDTVVATSQTVDKNSINNTLGSIRGIRFLFTSTITLSAGTYRVIIQNSNTALGASINVYSLPLKSATFCPAWYLTTTTNITATPITWTDTNTSLVLMQLVLEDTVAGSGGGISKSRYVNAGGH